MANLEPDITHIPLKELPSLLYFTCFFQFGKRKYILPFKKNNHVFFHSSLLIILPDGWTKMSVQLIPMSEIKYKFGLKPKPIQPPIPSK